MTAGALRAEEPTEAKLIDVAAVASRLGVSARTVWRLRDTGKLPAPVRVASCVRWREGDIAKWIAAGCPTMRHARGAR